MNAAGVEGVEEITEAEPEQEEEPGQERKTKTEAKQKQNKAEQNKTKLIASFGIFVGNTGDRVIDDRTRGSRMASGNFTTKPMMLWMSFTENQVATPTRTYVHTHHTHTYRQPYILHIRRWTLRLRYRTLPYATLRHSTLQPTTYNQCSTDRDDTVEGKL